MKKLKLVYVEWEDAHSKPFWTLENEAIRYAKTSVCVNKEVGWILYEDKQYLVIAASFSPGDEWSADQYGDLTKIPKTWVRKRKDLTKYL